MPVRIHRDIELLAHAQLELHAILHGEVDLAQVGIATLHHRLQAREYMERPLARTHRIRENGVIGHILQLFLRLLQGIDAIFKSSNIFPERSQFFFFMARRKKH